MKVNTETRDGISIVTAKREGGSEIRIEIAPTGMILIHGAEDIRAEFPYKVVNGGEALAMEYKNPDGFLTATLKMPGDDVDLDIQILKDYKIVKENRRIVLKRKNKEWVVRATM